MTDAGPLFAFDRLTVEHDGHARLRDVSGVIPATGITAIVGPSGSGKSTLLRCCNRLEAPTSGRVLFRGVDVATLDPRALRRRVGMVFQRPTPFPGTVRDNLLVADPALDDGHAVELLGRAHLGAAFLDRVADELSGGEAQRLCVARALAASPEAVLMDEVTSALDAAARGGLEDLGRSLAASGVPIVWVTHDFGQVTRVADRVLVMMEGRLAHAGPLEQLAVGAPADVVRFLEEAIGAE